MTFTPPTDGHGVYDSISVSLGQSQWGPQLTKIANAGFKLVMNYNALNGHMTDLLAYINYAAGLGLKVIVAIHSPAIWRDNIYTTTYASMYADSGNASTGIAFMQYLLGQLKSLSGVWGWYVGDEVAVLDHTAFKTYTDAVKAADATHPRLCIQGTSYISPNNFGTSTTPNWDCCDVGGDDYYYVGTFPGSGFSLAGLTTDAIGTQNYCITKGIQSAFALQSHSLSDYGTIGAPWPTVYDMIAARNAVLNNMAPRLVLWFAFYRVIENAAPINQLYYLENAVDGKSGLALFPAVKRRGSPDQNNSYVQTVTGDTPLAYYRLDEISGLTAFDLTNNHYNGIYHSNIATYAQPGAINQDSDTGVLLNTTYITLPSFVNGSGLNALSVECWINLSASIISNLTTPGNSNNIVIGDPSTANNSYRLYLVNSSGTIQLVFMIGNGTASYGARVTPALVANTWYYIAGTYDGVNVNVYFNGVLSGQLPHVNPGAIGITSATPTIGRPASGSNGSWPGLIDEFAVYTYDINTKVPVHYAAAMRAPSTSTSFPPATRRQS